MKFKTGDLAKIKEGALVLEYAPKHKDRIILITQKVRNDRLYGRNEELYDFLGNETNFGVWDYELEKIK